MYRNRAVYGALAFFAWILFADGEALKKVIFNSIECSLRGKLFSKIECQQASRQALSFEVTIGEQPVGNIFGVCELSLFPKGQRPMRPLKNIKLDICHLKRNLKTQSTLGFFYRALSKAAVNLPARCPYNRNTTVLVRRLTMDPEIPQYLPETNYIFKAKLYANNEVGLEVKITGGFYINGNDSTL